MKRFKIVAALALAAIVTTVSLSSFSGKEEAKAPVAIEKKADVKPFTIVTLFYHGPNDWQTSPVSGATCGVSGTFCSLSYDDTGVTRDPEDIAADAQAAYNLAANPASGTVQVRATANPTPLVTVTIIEKAL